MKASLRKAWLAALRSGEYKQIKGCLTALNYDGSIVGHCCLGVLCEVAGLPVDSEHESTANEMVQHFDKIRSYKFSDYNEISDSGLCGELADDVNRNKQIAVTPAGYLVDLNDNEGKTFPEIAQWIEDNIPEDVG